MTLFRIFTLAPVLALSACANMGANYEPILDGPPNLVYASDLHDCRNLARGQRQFSREAVGAAVAGGVFGGVMGSDEDDLTIAGGAIAGALFGLFGGVIEANQQRKSIVVRCMEGRGHPVVG